jgi:hypothetical protein
MNGDYGIIYSHNSPNEHYRCDQTECKSAHKLQSILCGKFFWHFLAVLLGVSK